MSALDCFEGSLARKNRSRNFAEFSPEFPQGIRRDPPRRLRPLLLHTLRACDRFREQSLVAFSDVAQRPVHGLTYIVAFVERVFLHERKPLDKPGIVRLFVVNRDARQRRKRQTPYELPLV